MCGVVPLSLEENTLRTLYLTCFCQIRGPTLITIGQPAERHYPKRRIRTFKLLSRLFFCRKNSNYTPIFLFRANKRYLNRILRVSVLCKSALIHCSDLSEFLRWKELRKEITLLPAICFEYSGQLIALASLLKPLLSMCSNIKVCMKGIIFCPIQISTVKCLNE